MRKNEYNPNFEYPVNPAEARVAVISASISLINQVIGL